MAEVGQKNAWAGMVPRMEMANIAIFEDSFVYIPTGEYELDLIDSVAWSAKDGQAGVASSVKFNWKMASGPHKGKPVGTYPGISEPSEGNARNWKAHYMTVGFPADQLNSLVPDPSHFFQPGRAPLRGYAHIDSPPESEMKTTKGLYANITLVRKETYLERIRNQSAQGQQPQQTPGFNVGSQQPGLPTQQPQAPMFQQTAPQQLAPQGIPQQQPQAPQLGAPTVPNGIPPPAQAPGFSGMFSPRQ